MTDDLQTDTCTDIFQNDQVTAIQVTVIQWMTMYGHLGTGSSL